MEWQRVAWGNLITVLCFHFHLKLYIWKAWLPSFTVFMCMQVAYLWTKAVTVSLSLTFWRNVCEEKQGCDGQLNCPGFWKASLVVLLNLQQVSSSVLAQRAQFPVTKHKERKQRGRKSHKSSLFHSLNQQQVGRAAALLRYRLSCSNWTKSLSWAKLITWLSMGN